MAGTIRLSSTDQDCVAWDRFVSQYPGAHYFQTYGWLKSYEPMALTPHLLIHEEAGVIRGGVAFLGAKLPKLPWQILIVPHGPLPSNPDSPSWRPLMQQLDEICRARSVVAAQLYPHELSNESVLLPRLEELGYTEPALLTSHRFSSTPVTLNLKGRTEDELLATFRPRTRQYIRRALSSGLVLRTEVDPALFDKIYDLLLEHGELMGYRPRPYASLRAAWEWFAPKGGATFIQAWREDVLVGVLLLVFTGRTAYYLAGAVRRGFTEHRPAEFLYWHGIRQAFERHLDTYDLVNIVSGGVEQFKMGFRPQCQTWHLPRTKLYRPGIARMISLGDRYLRPLARNWARRRAGRAAVVSASP
jgi:lipid II:glycine glycyltransferase (peptidoglycan interpeptide bridge formation enzyme)